ncbi:MAG: PsiF family protein [Pseudomonadota bacterium]|nr:PsiF family protein [Pseudomonadota bacterium]
MKTLMSVLALSVACLSASAYAADAKPMSTQQSKMKTCNVDAGDKKGDERKAFMKTCLSAAAPAEAPVKMTQQEKMKACNADTTAKTTKGDARKAFMKECLSK